MGPVTDVPLLERGSPETNRGPAVANPRIRVCSTVVSAAAPCHARSSGGHLASERIGDEHPCLQLLNRDMRVVENVLFGAAGWVSGLVNAFPREAVRLFDLAAARDVDAAVRLYRWF